MKHHTEFQCSTCQQERKMNRLMKMRREADPKYGLVVPVKAEEMNESSLHEAEYFVSFIHEDLTHITAVHMWCKGSVVALKTHQVWWFPRKMGSKMKDNVLSNREILYHDSPNMKTEITKTFVICRSKFQDNGHTKLFKHEGYCSCQQKNCILNLSKYGNERTITSIACRRIFQDNSHTKLLPHFIKNAIRIFLVYTWAPAIFLANIDSPRIMHVS